MGGYIGHSGGIVPLWFGSHLHDINFKMPKRTGGYNCQLVMMVSSGLEDISNYQEDVLVTLVVQSL